MTHLHSAHQHIYNLNGFHYTFDTPRIQHKILNDLLQLLPRGALHSTLASRLDYWAVPFNDDQIASMVDLVKGVSSDVPHFVLYSSLRSVYNAWNTEIRYGRDFHCRWCKMCHQDRLMHYLLCPAMLANFDSLIPGIIEYWHISPHPPCLPQLQCSAFLLELTDHTAAVRIMLMHDLLHFAFCEAKHGYFSGQWRALYRARAGQWVQHKDSLRQFL